MGNKTELKLCKKCRIAPKSNGKTVWCPKCGLKITVKPDAGRTAAEIWNTINTRTKSEIVWFGDGPKPGYDIPVVADITATVDLQDVVKSGLINSVDGYSFRNSDEY